MGPRSASGHSRAYPDGSREPMRMCVGCRKRAPRSVLVRLVVNDGRVVVDPSRSMSGRGAWLHPDPDCLAQAHRRGQIGRALRSPAADASDLRLPEV